MSIEDILLVLREHEAIVIKDRDKDVFTGHAEDCPWRLMRRFVSEIKVVDNALCIELEEDF